MPCQDIKTPRLILIPWNLGLVDALAAMDRARAEAALGIRFPEPFAPPPETGDVLEYFRDAIEHDASGGVFLPRMIIRSEDRMALGSIGLGAPDESGASFFGYGVYPDFEGNGFASEAATALVKFGLLLDGVAAVVATIPVGHVASEKVSSRAGLVRTGRQVEDGGTMLNVWERKRS